MYTVLIVDDEYIICESLKSKISRLGFREIGDIITCTSGEEAILISRKTKPQIVITDIKMPGMDGIQVIRELSVFLNPACFFVLSGYDDYAYVREAFRQGAIDYLLKPVRLQDLKNSIGSAIDKLKSSASLSAKQIGENYDIKLMINALINPEHLPDHIRAQTEELLTKSLPYSDFYVGLVGFKEDMSKINKDEVRDAVCHFIENLQLSNSNFHIIHTLTPTNYIFLLINVTSTLPHAEIVQSMSSLLTYLHDGLQLTNAGGLSERHKTIGKLSDMYRQAKFALASRLFHGYNSLYNYCPESNATREITIDSQIVFQLEAILDNPNLVLISRLFEQYLTEKYLSSLSVYELKYIYENIIYRIQTTIDSNLNAQLLKDPRDFFTFHSIDELRNYIRDCFYDFHKQFMESYTGEKTIVDLAKQYIQENYHKKITLADLANMFSVSYTHFSALFKKSTGCTFSEYLQKVRMEKACDLLKNPKNRIQDIAIQVGYDNAYHFSRAFKNYLGVSPKHYREGGTDTP